MRHMALRAVVRAPMLLLPTRGHVALPVGKVFHSACMTDFLLGHVGKFLVGLHDLDHTTCGVCLAIASLEDDTVGFVLDLPP